jgi:indolepyruvate ferredoxin oxidoreductase alpha subunit
MTGQQEHPGTGRSLNHEPASKIDFEELGRALGIAKVHSVDPMSGDGQFEALLREALDGAELTLIVARRPCVLAAPKIRFYEKSAAERQQTTCPAAPAS